MTAHNRSKILLIVSIVISGVGWFVTILAAIATLVGFGGIIMAPQGAYGWLAVLGIPPLGFGIVLIVVGRGVLKAAKTLADPRS